MTPLLLSLLLYAVTGNYTGSPCQDVSLGSCQPDPSSILHQKSGVTVHDCQLLCQIFSHCTIFQHQEQDDSCTLLSADYRLASCSTITGPSFRPGEDNILSACQQAISGNPNTCDGFFDETCTMDTEPQGDIEPGEIASPEDCAHICAIEQYAFFSFSLAQESTCSCFSSSSRTCHDLSGPPHPDMESCTHSSTTTTTTEGPGNTDVILISGGVVPGFLPGISPPHFTNTTEVLGSYCHVPNLPYPDSEVNDLVLFLDAPGHITVVTPDLTILACGGYIDDYEICYSLDLNSHTWVPHSILPFLTLGASAVVLDDGVYMMGFDYNDNCDENCTVHFYLYLPVGSTHWEQKALSEDRSLSIYPGACSVTTSAWTFLSIGQGESDSGKQVLQYDSRNSSWSLWAPLAEGRVGHACTLLNEEILIVGGLDLGPNYVSTSTTTTILNLHTKEVRQGGDMLTARLEFGLIMFDNKLLATGGVDNWDEETAKVVLFTEVWDEETESWAATDNMMTTPRAGFGHATVPLATVCP